MNHLKARSILLVAVIFLVLHGCAGIYSVVEFEVLEPATVNFPTNVNQLVILNRAPFTMDVFEKEDRKGMEDEHLVIIDTLISNNTFRGLLAMLRESPIENFHTPFWLSERRMDTFALDDLILTKPEVESILSRFGGDALISLEYYDMDLNEHYDYFQDDPNTLSTHYFELSNHLRWNIHIPLSPKPFDTYTMVDTMYFTDVLDGAFLPAPTMSEMIAEFFYNSGAKYGRYLVPVWTHTSRNLYKGRGDSLKLASKFTDVGEWEQAYDIWKRLSETSDDSTSISKAFHNMAIYYELEDRLDSASFLVDMALAYDSLELVENYREELDVRLLNQQQVREQVLAPAR